VKPRLSAPGHCKPWSEPRNPGNRDLPHCKTIEEPIATRGDQARSSRERCGQHSMNGRSPYRRHILGAGHGRTALAISVPKHGDVGITGLAQLYSAVFRFEKSEKQARLLCLFAAEDAFGNSLWAPPITESKFNACIIAGPECAFNYSCVDVEKTQERQQLFSPPMRSNIGPLVGRDSVNQTISVLKKQFKIFLYYRFNFPRLLDTLKHVSECFSFPPLFQIIDRFVFLLLFFRNSKQE
jgi:hypothetical protein